MNDIRLDEQEIILVETTEGALANMVLSHILKPPIPSDPGSHCENDVLAFESLWNSEKFEKKVRSVHLIATRHGIRHGHRCRIDRKA